MGCDILVLLNCDLNSYNLTPNCKLIKTQMSDHTISVHIHGFKKLKRIKFELSSFHPNSKYRRAFLFPAVYE